MVVCPTLEVAVAAEGDIVLDFCMKHQVLAGSKEYVRVWV